MSRIILNGVAMFAALASFALVCLIIVCLVNVCVWLYEHVRWMIHKRQSKRNVITIQPRVNGNPDRRPPEAG